jgi:hypothetical protein
MSVNANESSDTVQDFVRAMKASRCSQRRMARTKRKQGSGTPADAVFHDPHRRVRRARSVARSPVGVPPRRLLQRANTAAQFQNALPGTWHRQALPDSEPVPVQRPSRRPVIVPAGRFPKPPGCGGDEPPPAGTALAPPAVSPASVLVRERDVALVFKHNSNVKDSFDAELCR